MPKGHSFEKNMIGFICLVPLHYYFYRNIIKHIPGASFIIPPLLDKQISREYGGGMSGFGQYEWMKRFLNKKGAHLSEYKEMAVPDFVEYVNSTYDSVVCPHMFAGIEELFDKKIIKLVYGVPSDTRSLKFEYLYLMDIVITFGEESAQRIINKGVNAKPAGNPLFDDWFSGTRLNMGTVNSLASRLDSSKKTLLYLPTWGPDSSIDLYWESIAALSEKYNVVVKMHHCSFYGEMNRVCRIFADDRVIAFGDNVDPLELYGICDLVIADGVSGAVFDAMLADKPLLTIHTPLSSYGLMTAGSHMKGFFDSVPFENHPADLCCSIDSAIRKFQPFPEQFKQLYFSDRDGCSGKRAADIILSESAKAPVSMAEKYEKALLAVKDKRAMDVIQGAKRRYESGRNKRKSRSVFNNLFGG